MTVFSSICLYFRTFMVVHKAYYLLVSPSIQFCSEDSLIVINTKAK